jgi:asparagine synthetase B (glutamine-hydrolysing)
MSWIFAIVGPIDNAIRSRVTAILPTPIGTFSGPGITVYWGGNPDTIYSKATQENGFVVCGFGLHYDAHKHSYVDHRAWETLLAQRELGLNAVQGQFAGVRWSDDGVELFNDLFGSRELYYAVRGVHTFISTRLDWVSRAVGGAAIDAAAFGGKWLHFYQLSYNSLLKDIARLPPGGRVTISAEGSIATRRERFDPVANEGSGVAKILKAQILATQNTPFTTNVALSGGLDSRLVLSVLLHDRADRWKAYTLGSAGDGDVEITRQLSERFHFEHRVLSTESAPPVEEAIDYAGHVMLLRPFSSFAQQQLLKNIHDPQTVMIDGSYGEILRRYGFKRLSWFGSLDIMRGNVQRVSKLARKFRADIFNTEFQSQLQTAALNEMEEVFRELPPVSKIGVANWIDLLVYVRGTPNLNAAEQARTDHHYRSFMPFLQVPMLQAGLNMPLSQRRNSRWVKAYIRATVPELASYSLAGLHSLYPFNSRAVHAYLYQRLKRKLQPRHHVTPRVFHYKDFILDLLSDRASRENVYLDRSKVKHLRARYESDDHSVASQIDWLVAFLLWTDLAQVR